MRLPNLVGRSWWLFSILLFTKHVATADNVQAYSQSPPIRAKIQASWNAAPLAVQILETVALESPSAFFPILSSFVAALDDPEHLKSPLEPAITPEEVYTRSLKLINATSSLSSLNEAALDGFKLGLSLREASPLIETHYQIYRQLQNTSRGLDLHGSTYELYGQCRDSLLSGLISSHVCEDARNPQPPSIYSFDHVKGAEASDTTTTLVLYADILSPGFPQLYKEVIESSGTPGVRIVLRWKPTLTPAVASQKLVLSGYGVGLDLKRVDYITIDDRDLQDSQKDAIDQHTFRIEHDAEVLVSQEHGDVFSDADAKSSELVQLKAEQIRDIGIRATQFIMSAPSPLAAFTKLVQDFPRYAHKLVTSWAPETQADVIEELLEIQSNYIDGGSNHVWLNGMALKSIDLRPFTLLRIMRDERQRVNDLVKLGLTTQQAINILGHPALSAAIGAEVPTRGPMQVSDMGDFFDATDRREMQEVLDAPESLASEVLQPVITYWNDIEKDARYKHWPPTLQSLLQPTYPGQMPQVRRNLINVILALDFEKTLSHAILAESITPFISRGLGIRFGSAPILGKNSQGSTGELAAKVSWYLLEHTGRVTAMDFHRQLATVSTEILAEKHIRKAYRAALEGYKEKKRQQTQEAADESFLSFEELKQSDKMDIALQRARRYSRRLGLAPQDDPRTTGVFFVNGKLFPMNEGFRSNLQQTLQTQMQHVMQQVYFGGLQDTQDVSLYFYDQPSTFASRNPLIVPEEGKAMRFVNIADIQEGSGLYCASDAPDKYAAVSVWLVLDTTMASSAALLQEAAKLAANDSGVRICIVHAGFILSKREGYASSPPLHKWLVGSEELDPRNRSPISASAAQEAASKGNAFAARAGIQSSLPAIIINGRVIEEIDPEDFAADDFKALVALEKKARIDPVVAAMSEALDITTLPDMAGTLSAVTSIIAPIFYGQEEINPFTKRSLQRSRDYNPIPANLTSLQVGDESKATLQFAFVVDPLNEVSQSWSALIQTLAAMETVSIRVYFNPILDRTEMPLKRFYRYSLAAETSFDANGSEAFQEVVFKHIPQSTLLTLALETQHAWQAFPKESVHDLDNIRLSDLKPSARETGVEATFELSNIIVEGHAREKVTNTPPRGLQLELSDGFHATNTLVMANLGYHQLQANPGLWTFSIREGRSSEVFELDSMEGAGSAGPSVDGKGWQVLVTSFEGVTVFPKFTRKAGMDGVDLLDENATAQPVDVKAKAAEALSGLKNRVQSFFGKAHPESKDSVVVRKSADINIFTVASGLLYERMAMIMILSVLKHTESTVKFWFIENFLSPSFKAFIPHLAEQYNFQYELVTYTWPAWLRGQKEKQRTIWGYKILFLDVLFPLELDRVIFVDSDQIVRTDLKQLVDLDLRGAPYAYAPMGDDREDMDNFRFWKGGYWADHLRGRPYHISALYVIDLDRFRQIAAGDRLRGQYQALSADPNSLANLDQDLPNNMQAQLPIYTLDRSWLWCETWCSDESLKDAKTIDLCNNPKTHEPKLARAKRLIPEWTVYDKEIAALATKIAAENKSKLASSDAVGLKREDSADAFVDEAGQLEQAREQQKEFVQEGTGAKVDAASEEQSPEEVKQSAHIAGEL